MRRPKGRRICYAVQIMESALSRWRRAMWSGFVGGALGGLVAAQCFALIVASNSFGIEPMLFGVVVILCGATGGWFGNGYLRGRLRPFGLAEIAGAEAGIVLALLALSPMLNPYARNEAFVLDFVLFVSLAGLTIGAVIGLVMGAILGLLEGEVIDALRRWFWLLGALIAVAVTGGSLLFDANNIVASLAVVTIPGGALAGWLAQREYLRIGLGN